MNSPLNTDFWTWPVAVRGVLAMNFPSYTGSKKIIMRDDAPFNFFWPIDGYFEVELCKVDVWNRIARALQPCGIPK